MTGSANIGQSASARVLLKAEILKATPIQPFRDAFRRTDRANQLAIPFRFYASTPQSGREKIGNRIQASGLERLAYAACAAAFRVHDSTWAGGPSSAYTLQRRTTCMVRLPLGRRLTCARGHTLSCAHSSSSTARTIVASTVTASAMANEAPRQTRAPVPNGR